ncbi:hypothetical protein BU15DRAFT_86078 [Melanogaster broomeanus]|nr:hypothetical protein BU15DRAFT_86078 [Melanogaster broomeanus]
MPPQPGMFALPYASTHKARADMRQRGKRKGKIFSGKLGKEMTDRRDEGRHFAEHISALHSSAIQLASRPETHPLYNLRMYPLSLERSAVVAQLVYEEKHNLVAIETAYEEERERVEMSIEERRRRAREEKEGEGALNDASLDSQTRAHITRKLRNKVGTSPPPTPLGLSGLSLANGSMTPITSAPLTNPHSLSVDEIPSPFPFPLTSVTLTNGHHSSSGGGGGGSNGNRRRNKTSSSHQSLVGVGGLGKSLAFLGPSKETEIEADLIEIRRGTKRRRAAAISSTKVS